MKSVINMCTYKSCQIGSSWMELQVQRNSPPPPSPCPFFPRPFPSPFPLSSFLPSPSPLPLFSVELGWRCVQHWRGGGGGGWRGRADIARGINLNHWLWNFSKHGTTHIGLLQCLHIIRVCLLLNFVLHTTQFRFLPLRPGKCGCWLESLELESWLACCAGLYVQVERRPSITFTRNSKPDKRLFVGMLL